MKLTRQQATKLVAEIWRNYDKDDNGHLDRSESILLFRDIAQISKDPSILQQADQIMKFLDKDGDGKLSKDEMIDLLTNNF